MQKRDEAVTDALEDRALSLSEFMRQPVLHGAEVPAADSLSPDLRIRLRKAAGWWFVLARDLLAHIAASDELAGRKAAVTPWREGPGGLRSLEA